MLSKEQKKLSSIIILNVIAIFIFWAIFMYWIYPSHSEMLEKIDQANATFSKNNEIKSNWFSYDELYQIMNTKWFQKDILDLMKDRTKAEQAIKKTWWWDYISWLNSEIAKNTVLTSEISKNEKIIWNILPVFYQYWSTQWSTSTQIKQQISLENFINFVENNILRKFRINSFSTLWIDNITFGSDDPTQTQSNSRNIKDDSVWSFVLKLEFEAKNEDLVNFLDNIQKSWKLNIVDWKLANQVSASNIDTYSNLDNLLITVDNLVLKDSISNAWEKNSWNIALRFYVRWIWYEQYMTIQSRISNRFNALYTNILTKSKLCDNVWNPVCKDSQWSQAVSSIRSLLKDITLIKQKVDQKKKDFATSRGGLDISKELSDWLAIDVSLDWINSAYEKSVYYVNFYSKTWAK